MSKHKLNYNTSYRLISDDEDEEDDHNGDIIRCICDDMDDDGFTIQCEDCLDWQHASCVNIKRNNIPEHYLCDRCRKKLKKRPLDPPKRKISSGTDSITSKGKENKYSLHGETTHRVVLGTKRLKKKKKRAHSSDDSDNSDYTRPIKKNYSPISKSVIQDGMVDEIYRQIYKQWSIHKTKNIENTKYIKGLDHIMTMDSSLLLPSIPKVSVKPLQRLLRSSFQSQKDPTVEKGLFADVHIPEDRFLLQVTGEVLLKSEYKSNPHHRYPLLGIPLRHVFFHPSFDLCIDARYRGNDARFIRHSCYPNAEIRNIIIPRNDHTLHMGIYTIEEVAKGEEITIGWNWQRGKMLWKKYQEFTKKKYTDTKRMDEEMKEAIRKMLDLFETEYGDCACEDKEDCFIEHLKEEVEVKKKLKARKPQDTRRSSSDTRKSTKSHFFSSSDEDRKAKKIRKNKKDQLTKKSITPPSPAGSVDDTMDIDVISATTVRKNEEMNAKNEETIVRNEEVDVKNEDNSVYIEDSSVNNEGDAITHNHLYILPPKKRWLAKYYEHKETDIDNSNSSQGNGSHSNPHVNTTMTTTHNNNNISIPLYDSKPIPPCNEYDYMDDADLSDGASSQSTLPMVELVDQLVSTTIHSLHQGKDHESDTNDNPMMISDLIADDSKQDNHHDDTKLSLHQEKPKVKLSIQEYLSMRRQANLLVNNESSLSHNTS
ncbi:hypothetical protein BDB01DRAFT_794451 [Pilobolus umbonatus]|nr:hypothetical protein BDB01DRAFT_794451 [Pilobolus umbonatus]